MDPKPLKRVNRFWHINQRWRFKPMRFSMNVLMLKKPFWTLIRFWGWVMVVMVMFMFMMFMFVIGVMDPFSGPQTHQNILPQPIFGFAHSLRFWARQIFLKAHCEFTITFTELVRTRVSIRLLGFTRNWKMKNRQN